jgi:hypothetical protein
MKIGTHVKGVKLLSEYKQVFSIFISEERFDLHSYLTYLFINECKDDVVNQLEQEHVNQ